MCPHIVMREIATACTKPRIDAPCVVILNTHSVILNGVKNLEVSEAVDGSTNLEILRFTQDDIEPTIDHAHIAHSQRGDASTSLSMTIFVTPICCQSGALQT